MNKLKLRTRIRRLTQKLKSQTGVYVLNGFTTLAVIVFMDHGMVVAACSVAVPLIILQWEVQKTVNQEQQRRAAERGAERAHTERQRRLMREYGTKADLSARLRR